MHALDKAEEKNRRKAGSSEMKEEMISRKKPKLSRENDDTEGIHALANVEESTKKPDEPSKRQIKREKAQRKLLEQREAGKLDAAQKGLQYISKWKHARGEWKFEKRRQIWLMDHLLHEDLLPDSVFPYVIEYFEGCKGMARQLLVKKMMEVIKKVEEQQEIEEDTAVLNTTEYRRAREILQALPTET